MPLRGGVFRAWLKGNVKSQGWANCCEELVAAIRKLDDDWPVASLVQQRPRTESDRIARWPNSNCLSVPLRSDLWYALVLGICTLPVREPALNPLRGAAVQAEIWRR